MDELTKNLECPLQWLSCRNEWKYDYLANENKGSENMYPQHDFIQLMRQIMYSCAKLHEDDKDEAKLSIERAEEMFSKQVADVNISREVLSHIILSSKYYILKEQQADEKTLTEVLQSIPAIDHTNVIQKATLNACIAGTYCSITEYDYEIVIEYLRKSISDNPECALWYNELAHVLHKKRRHQGFGIKPTQEEIDLFKRSDKLSKDPFFGIQLAELYRNLKCEKALKLYKEIHQQNPTCIWTRNRLILGFTRLRKFELARECIDYVEKHDPKNTSCLHMKAIYCQETGKKDTALRCLEELIEIRPRSFGVRMDYVRLKLQLKNDPDFHYTEYLLQLISLFKNTVHENELLLNLGLSYEDNEDFFNALCSYRKVIESDPEQLILKKFCPRDHRNRKRWDINIYDRVYKIIDKWYSKYLDRKTINFMKEMEKLCKPHYTNL